MPMGLLPQDSGIIVQYVSAVAPLVLDPARWRRVVCETSLTGPLAITLPNAANCQDGDTVEVKDASRNCAANNISVSGDAPVDGVVGGYVLVINGESVTFVYNTDAAQWLLF